MMHNGFKSLSLRRFNKSHPYLKKTHKTTTIKQRNCGFPSCRNNMESLPDWLCEAKKLEVLDVSHNLIAELPPW